MYHKVSWDIMKELEVGDIVKHKKFHHMIGYVLQVNEKDFTIRWMNNGVDIYYDMIQLRIWLSVDYSIIKCHKISKKT